jgi:hypothetical protein
LARHKRRTDSGTNTDSSTPAQISVAATGWRSGSGHRRAERLGDARGEDGIAGPAGMPGASPLAHRPARRALSAGRAGR